MLTLVDKAMLVKFYYLSEELAVEALRIFRTEKKMKISSGPITLAGLISLTRRDVSMKREIFGIGLAVVHHDCQRFVFPVWFRK